MILFWIITGVVALVLVGLVMRTLRARGLGRWMVTYLMQSSRRRTLPPDEEIHVLLCIADHFEPKGDGANRQRAAARVRHWVETYPRQLGVFRDSDGRPPRHTLFYPLEEYEPDYVEALAGLCRAGFGEIEVHLHHQNDTGEHLREQLLRFRDMLAGRHGLLSRDRDSGEIAYGFVHGNWALCNSRPDSSWCGVNDELDVLRETGCYADFTYPSAPDPTQPIKINSLYYAKTLPSRVRSCDYGVDVGRAPQPPGSLLLIQGPLVLDWSKRKWGAFPRLENGCLQGSQPPAIERLDRWLRARIQVPGRPDWFFVKLHAHGAEEASHETLLGEPMRLFHEGLARRARENPRFHYHYVTAREMYNLVKAAEAGWKGSVGEARDCRLVSNLGRSESSVGQVCNLSHGLDRLETCPTNPSDTSRAFA